MNRDMDTSERDKFGVDNRSDDHLSYQRSYLSATQWQFGNQILGFVSPNSAITLCQGTHMGSSPSPSVSITDSFCSTFMMPSTLDTGGVFLKTDNGALPPSLSNFPTDSAFIERAARFSCFNGGNFRGVANQEIGIIRNHSFDSGSPIEDQRDAGSLHDVRVLSKESSEMDLNGGVQEESANLGSVKKRKRTIQDMELDQVEGAEQLSVETSKENKDTKQKGEEKCPTMETMKPSLKKTNDSSNLPKEDYIHVRARRGQATNSHSLAERVRREKISERMKFLQDLVPSCSKVTGKAVMLDEIINYVQSLQRQVEFLSMKLASVNERSDFNMEGLLSKDFIQSRIDSSSTMGFSHDMIHPQLRPPQSSLVQGGMNTVTHLSDVLRRSINAPLRIINGYKESTPQIPASWDGELHNVLQMNFGASNSVIDATQDGAHSRSG